MLEIKNRTQRKQYSFAYIQTSTFLINSNTLNFIVLFAVILSPFFFSLLSFIFNFLFCLLRHFIKIFIISLAVGMCIILCDGNAVHKMATLLMMNYSTASALINMILAASNNDDMTDGITTMRTFIQSSKYRDHLHFDVFCARFLMDVTRAKYPALVCINYNNQR